MEAERSELQNHVAELDQDNKRLQTELQQTSTALNRLETKYQQLWNSTRNAAEAGKQAAAAQSRIKELESKLETLTQANKQLRSRDALHWFLAGGGVLLIGWLLGRITLKSRRRSSLLQ